jgi:hypothetical protein
MNGLFARSPIWRNPFFVERGSFRLDFAYGRSNPRTATKKE